MMHAARYFRAFAGLTCAGLLSLTLSHATILNFDNLLLSDGDLIPEYYGSRVNSAGVDAEGRTGFNLTHGATPNVTVRMYYGWLERRAVGNGDEQFIWHRDDLLRFASASHENYHRNLAYCPEPAAQNWYETGRSLFIFLSADPGYLITLHRVEGSPLAEPGWSRATFGVRTGSSFDYNMNPTYGQDGPNRPWGVDFGPPIYVASHIVLILNYYSIRAGIDNIGFSQQLIPEPASLLALGAGLTGLISLRRRRNYGSVSKPNGV